MGTVYVVVAGEWNAGSVRSVFAEKPQALAAALLIDPVFDGGWVPAADRSDCWRNGCDFVAVETHEVQ